MSASLVYLEQDGSGPAALKISVPQSDTRIPTHFIALIDISDSMRDGKLTHVKHCMSLLLKFLSPNDVLSLITFGDTSNVVLNRVKAVAGQIPIIDKAIQSLVVDGSTNYSAGLASVCEILETPCPLKTGLLTLTDGHANCGVSDPPSLVAMISKIHERYPSLSFSFVAYGTDHNDTLLKRMSDTVMGSYSIVSDLEGAATAMGESLGGIISCAAQNVSITCPLGTKAHGPYTVKADRLLLGDLYAGTDTTILLETVPGPFTFSGVTLPDLSTFRLAVPTTVDTSQNIEIDVTRLRYKCSDLFRDIRDALGSDENFDDRIAEFRAAINNAALAEHPVIGMLKNELISIEAAINNIRIGRTDGLRARLNQHAAFTSQMRGMTTTIESCPASTPRSRGATTPRAPRRRAQSPAEDPNRPNIVMSPTTSIRQTRMATMMREASQGGAPEPEPI